MGQRSRAKNVQTVWTLEKAQAHQAKHGFSLPIPIARPAPQHGLAPRLEDKTTKDTPKGSKKRQKTTPEREMELMLGRELAEGKIAGFAYEAITLVVGDPDCRYTPDFDVYLLDGRLRFIETKGAFIREDGLVKFKAARRQYPHFEFQLHQRNKTGWKQLL